MKQFFTAALFVTMLGSVTPASDNSAIISSAQLLDDLAVLKQAYEALHPGLYRYNTPEQMQANFDLLHREFSRDRTLPEAYLLISQFCAKVKCGHTYANFFNQPKLIVNALFRGRNCLPFNFSWIDKRMIVTRNISDDPRLKPGTEVLEINGNAVAAILDSLMSIARADGSNDAKRISYLEVAGNDEFEAFDIYFPMLFPQKESALKLLVRDKGADVTIVVEATTAETRRRRQSPTSASVAPEAPDAARWTIERIKPTVALLRMPTWALYNSKWDWKAFLNAEIDRLIDDQVANLIVDLRGNEGGQDCGHVILSRMIAEELQVRGYERRVRYRTAPAELIKYLDTWDRSFDDWGEQATDFRDGFYRLKRFDDAPSGEVIKPIGKRYSGRLHILIDASNSSATFQFAKLVQQYKLGTLIGHTTGGNRRGINGGAFFFLRLPNSKIEVDLPLIGFFPTSEQPDAGIEPDVVVQPSISDIAAGVDTDLRAALEHLKR